MILKKHQKAFSLVELSMVILIIGILIGGVSQGIDLYSDFKLASARNLTSGSIVARVPNLSMWWETTMENSFANPKPNDGELINQWNDINTQRAMKINLFNTSNSASRPAYKASAINNLPALKFSNAQELRSADIKGDIFFSDNEITVFDAEVSANKSSGNILQSNIIHQASRSKEPSQQYYSTATSPRFDFPVKQAKIKPYAGVSKIIQR